MDKRKNGERNSSEKIKDRSKNALIMTKRRRMVQKGRKKEVELSRRWDVESCRVRIHWHAFRGYHLLGLTLDAAAVVAWIIISSQHFFHARALWRGSFQKARVWLVTTSPSNNILIERRNNKCSKWSSERAGVNIDLCKFISPLSGLLKASENVHLNSSFMVFKISYRWVNACSFSNESIAREQNTMFRGRISKLLDASLITRESFSARVSFLVFASHRPDLSGESSRRREKIYASHSHFK